MSATHPSHPSSTAPDSDHAAHSGGHGPAPPSAEELAESRAARRAVARAVGRPLGAALAVFGAGWSLALLGQGDVIVLPLALLLGGLGLALLAVARDLRDPA